MGGWVLGAGGGPLHIIGRWRRESSCSVPLESSLNTHTHVYTKELVGFGPLGRENQEGKHEELLVGGGGGWGGLQDSVL